MFFLSKGKFWAVVFFIMIFSAGCSTKNDDSDEINTVKQQEHETEISDEVKQSITPKENIKNSHVIKDTAFIEKFNHEELNNDGFYEIETFPYYYDEKVAPLINIYRKSQDISYSDLTMVKHVIDEGLFSSKSWWEKADGYPLDAEVKYFYYGDMSSGRPSGLGVIYQYFFADDGIFFFPLCIGYFKNGNLNGFGLRYAIPTPPMNSEYEFGNIPIYYFSEYYINDSGGEVKTECRLLSLVYEGDFKDDYCSGEGVFYNTLYTASPSVSREVIKRFGKDMNTQFKNNTDMYSFPVDKLNEYYHLHMPVHPSDIEFIGEISDNNNFMGQPGEMTGSGIAFDIEGNKKFEGKIKGGVYSSGKVYLKNGNLFYEGSFWYTTENMREGTAYNIDGSILSKGSFEAENNLWDDYDKENEYFEQLEGKGDSSEDDYQPPNRYFTIDSILNSKESDDQNEMNVSSYEGNNNYENSDDYNPGSDIDYAYLNEFIDAINRVSDPPDLSGEELEEYYKKEYEAWVNGEAYFDLSLSSDTEQSVTSTSGEYIIPYSDSTVLTDNDLNGFSAKELTYARNEIYARKGYIFKSTELYSYFKNLSWYCPDPDYDDHVLSDIEKYNVQFILDYQNRYDLLYKPE